MIYLDYNASTPLDPAVREAMQPYLGSCYGNPSSSHSMGTEMKKAVTRARGQVADLLGATPEEVVFTSGGTESNNHVIKGVAHTLRDKGRHIIVSAVEHPAVIKPCAFLASLGYEISHVGVDAFGCVDPDDVKRLIRDDTILISIMHANNEVGTIQPIADIAAAARARGVWVHTDAAQSCGKIETTVHTLGVDFLSVAGHKLYAPQGVGALFVRDGIAIEPIMHGAGHESGRRAGTEAVVQMVALGTAAELAKNELPCDAVTTLRDRLHKGLSDRLGDRMVLLGHPAARLPSTLAVAFPGKVGASVLSHCGDICATTGAACHDKGQARSAVLTAMKVPDEVAFGAVRLSVGRFTTTEEVDTAIDQIARAVEAA